MAQNRSTAEILSAAAAYIEVHGWSQRALEDEEGRVCALGALRAVEPSIEARVRAKRELLRRIQARNPQGAEEANDLLEFDREHPGSKELTDQARQWLGVSYWNNAWDRTAEDVIGVMRNG